MGIGNRDRDRDCERDAEDGTGGKRRWWLWDEKCELGYVGRIEAKGARMSGTERNG